MRVRSRIRIWWWGYTEISNLISTSLMMKAKERLALWSKERMLLCSKQLITRIDWSIFWRATEQELISISRMWDQSNYWRLTRMWRRRLSTELLRWFIWFHECICRMRLLTRRLLRLWCKWGHRYLSRIRLGETQLWLQLKRMMKVLFRYYFSTIRLIRLWRIKIKMGEVLFTM